MHRPPQGPKFFWKVSDQSFSHFFRAGFPLKTSRPLEETPLVDFWTVASFMAASPPRTPATPRKAVDTPKSRGRPQNKHKRPDAFSGFERCGDANDFVRGAIWVLHLLEWSQRDISAATNVSQSQVSRVISECEEEEFLYVWGFMTRMILLSCCNNNRTHFEVYQ